MNLPRIIGPTLFVFCIIGPAIGQTISGPEPWMMYPLDQGARPEGCGTSGFSVAKPDADLFSGMGVGRNLERLTRTQIREVGIGSQNVQENAFYKAVAPAIVLIVTDGPVGSGTLIDDRGDVLTNWHVVRGFTDVAVIFKPAQDAAKPASNDIVRGRVVRVDEVSDLALVRLAALPAGRTPLALGNARDIAVGKIVQAVGHPAADTWAYSQGVISEYRPGFDWSAGEKGQEHHADVILMQMPVNPGSSGEPVMNDAGAVVGVNSFRDISAQASSLAVSIDEVRAFLARQSDRHAKASLAADTKAVSATTCEGKEVYQGRTVSNDGLMVAFDMRCTGHVDLEIVIPDDQSKPTLLRADRNLDGKPDVLMLDLSRRGQWDVSFWDSNFDGTWGLVGRHPGGDIAPSYYESAETYGAPIAHN